LQNDKREIIESKLELERIARNNAVERIKGNELFVSYSYNPFVKETSPFHSLAQSSNEEKSP
jgi:hypothetical protein